MKKFIISIFIFLLLAGGVTFWLLNKNKNTSPQQVSPTQLTYTSKLFGFSFSYPNNLKLVNGTVTDTGIVKESIGFFNNSNLDEPLMYLYVKNIDQYSKDYINNFNGNRTLGTIVGKRFSIKDDEGLPQDISVFPYQNVYIVVSDNAKTDANEQVVNSILDSFKQ